MILKKPYAFLIKYYRVIHLALAFLLGVGAYRLLDVVKFFNDYVKNGYTTTVVTDLEKLYTPFSLFIIIFLIVIFATAILILLVHKKKQVKFYALLVTYYSVVFIALFYISSILQSFETELLASTLARSLRDIFIIVYLPQFIFIVFILLRTIGFNVKKFDFADERKEINTDIYDDEEFEINVNIESYKFKQKINRIFRESVYYVKENKFIVMCVCIVFAFSLGVYIYNNIHTNYDQHYKMGNTFIYQNLNVTVHDAIISNLDHQGNVIDDNYYLVLKTNITNTSGYTIDIDYNNFKLMVGNDIITPTVNMASKFIDFASSNVTYSISHNGNNTFSLVYKLTKNQIKKNMELRIHNHSYYEKDEYVNASIFVKIKTSKISDLAIAGNYSQGDTLNFDDTYLKNTSLKIKDYVVDKRYVYRYEICNAEQVCKEYTDAITVPVKDGRYNNRLIILSVEYLQDLDIGYGDEYTSLASFADNFMTIQYKVSNEVFSAQGINVTPQKATNFIAFEVPQNIEYASIIQSIVTIRNKEYIINLKAMN